MARPNIGTVNPGGAFTITGGNRTLTLGNPFIDPIRGDRLTTLSFEWYFAPESALVVGLFYKDISSFIATTAQQIPFNQLGLPTSLLAGTDRRSRPICSPSPSRSTATAARSRASRSASSRRSASCPACSRNLGIQANYTYVKSDIEYPLADRRRRAGR